MNLFKISLLKTNNAGVHEKKSTPYDQQFARYHHLSVTGLRP